MLTHLRTVLRSAARALGVERAAHAALAVELWPQIVGPEAAAATRVTGLRAGVLLVDAQPGMWAQELSLRRSQLAAALNVALGESVIEDIRIRQQPLGRTRPTQPTQPTQLTQPQVEEIGEQERARIERAVADIKDPELRDVTRRAMISQARWKRRRGARD